MPAARRPRKCAARPMRPAAAAAPKQRTIERGRAATRTASCDPHAAAPSRAGEARADASVNEVGDDRD